MALRSQHVTLEPPTMAEVRRQYILRDSAAVEDYLADHADVWPFLSSAAMYLRTAFPPDTAFVLDVPPDYENDGTRDLFVRIQTHLDVDEALKRLSRFSERWWRRASAGAPDSLHFTTEYV